VLEWTSDGQAILFETRKANTWKLMRLPVNGGAPESTGFEGMGQLQSVDSSPDGSQLVYGHQKNIDELWALDNVLAALK
jgi:Tol biopolymer transport system component